MSYMKIGEIFRQKPTEDIRVLIAGLVSMFSTTGILVAGYLTVKHFEHSHISACPVFGSGCDIVTNSSYSVLFGFLPVAVLGVGYYATILMAQTVYAFSGNKLVVELSGYISAMGAIFSVYLLYLQGVVIGAYCFYCVSSAVLSFLIFACESPLIVSEMREKMWEWRVERSMTVLLDKTAK